MAKELGGRDLAAERVRAGVTARALSAVLGLTPSDLSKIENARMPTNAEFNARYMAALKQLEGE